MADYSEEVADAQELILEFGGTFTIRRQSPTPADPDKPWKRDQPSELSFDVTGVMLEFKKSQQSQGFTAGSEDSSFVVPGDMIIYIAADPLNIPSAPIVRDIVETPAHGSYNVVENMILAPNGQEILYKLWVRK